VEWIHFTGTGYLLRLSGCSIQYCGLSVWGCRKTCRRLVIALMQFDAIDIIHLDAFGDVLPEFATFDW